jgi:hypothetical protein
MSWTDLLAAAEAVRSAATAREPGIAALTLAGIGWATVERERATRELDDLLGPAAARGHGEMWLPATRDELLGAGAWTRFLAADPATTLVVLEPDTEGRLAASLARHGEGVAAVYLRSRASHDRGAVARAGPLGSGRLVAGGQPWGPHAIVLSGTSR